MSLKGDYDVIKTDKGPKESKELVIYSSQVNIRS